MDKSIKGLLESTSLLVIAANCVRCILLLTSKEANKKYVGKLGVKRITGDGDKLHTYLNSM